MNPPTPETIQRAMDTLVASAYQENPDPSQAQNDTSSLASTIYHIKMLKTALEGFKAVAEVELTRLEQHQNDVPVPIQTLAVEMLVQILHKTLSSQSWRDDLHRIAGVCKYWRSVILKFPEFWTNIDHTYPEDIIKTYLSRSGRAPLEITYFGDEGTEFVGLDRFVNLMKAEAHHTRWRSLQLFTESDSSNLISVAAECPNLADFTMHNLNGITPVIPALSQSLSILYLHRVILQNPDFPNLRHLTLVESQRFCVSAQAFIQFIAGLLMLEVLVLHQVQLPRASQLLPPGVGENKPGPEAIFPSLKILHIVDAPHILTDYHVPRLHAPALHHIVVNHLSSQTFDSPNPPLIRPLKKFSDAAFKLEITVLPVMRKILFRASPPHYKSRFRQRRPPVGDYEAGAWISTTCATAAFVTFENVLKCLSSGIVGNRPIHLLFDGETDGVVPPFPPLHPMELVIPPSSVSILPGVETIKIKGTITADPLLQHLGESSTNTDGTISWPCPRLSKLDLSEWAEFEMAVIEELVARRWDCLESQQGEAKLLRSAACYCLL